MKQKLSLLTFLLGLIGLMYSPKAIGQSVGEVRGFLKNAQTGEAVIFTPVFTPDRKHVAVTNENGYFSMTKLPAGNYTLLAHSLGYDTARQQVTVVAQKINTIEMLMTERITELEGVEISARQIEKTTTVNASVVKIAPREIKLMPSIGGEPDLAQYIQTIPGVITTGDQGGQVIIRGGAPVQNLVLLDGMVVVNPFHSIGLFSVFDTEILKSANVYTGGFGPEFGGRANAVMDIKTITGNQQNHTGVLGVNPFAARLSVNGPIFKGKNITATYVGSFRNSYLDQTSKTLYDYAGDKEMGIPFSFRDFYGKVTLDTRQGTRLSLFGFQFNDKAQLNPTSAFEWNSNGFGGNFFILPSQSSVLISGNFGFSNYDINLTQQTEFPRNSNVTNFNGQIDFSYAIKKSELKYGLGFMGNNTDYTAVGVVQQNALVQNYTANNTEIFGFAKYRWVPSDKLVVEPGLRVHYYASLGVFSMEPRIGAKYNVTQKIRLKVAGGLYSQNLISTRSDRDVVNLFNGYISSLEDVRNPDGSPVKDVVDRAVHYVAGIEYDILDNLELNFEVYQKDFLQIINVNRDRVFAEDPEFVAEEGLARGMDITLKGNPTKNVLLQLGYSLSWVERSLANWTYHPHFDRRHNLNLMGSFQFGPGKTWEVGVRWNLGSGFPFTQTVAFYEDLNFGTGLGADYLTQNGNLGIYYGGRNNYNQARLPYYHRLDVSVKKTFRFGRNSKLVADVSVINAYNRDNLFYFDRISFERVNQLPVIPSAGLSFYF